MVVEALITIVLSFFSALITWSFARKKNEAEIDSIEIDNVEKAVGIWREMAENLQQEIISLRKNQEELIEQNNSMRKEIIKLEALVHQLKKTET